ncbi:MAG TPA: sigma-70 family RNA polymerase sigma factor [Polyangia bacterium]|nr:sigma-70 family RNA polymerase sigma factor [Polyangia bacterium]
MRAGELDAETLARARAGDPRAFRALYEHHADAVYAFLRRMLPHGAAAEDALQDAFLRVLRALPGFDPHGPARLSTWIFTIARRVALTAIDRRRPPPAEAPAAAAQAQPELRLALEAAVAALPEVLRSTFVLREGCDLSYEEVAAVEEIDVGTVKSRLHRARAALQAALAEKDPPAKERSGHGHRATR